MMHHISNHSLSPRSDNFGHVLYILFPAIAMMLGWGLRGYIGGGPFGAMIPGAMVAICISMLHGLPVRNSMILAVFGVVGIGLGGEMTYGQTLGFLLKPGTVWWGTLGTSVKGSIWGLNGGILLAMGIIYNRLSRGEIVIGLLILAAGMLAGFKLINQPMIIYFSDRANPRPESWGALLLGGLSLLVWLRLKADPVSFRIVTVFAIAGTIGGALGFGLGGFWMVLGSRVPSDTVFTHWWKSMEFTFGLLLGGALGLASWLLHSEIASVTGKPGNNSGAADNSLIGTVAAFVAGILMFLAIPSLLDPIVDAGGKVGEFTMVGLRDLAIIFSNYSFYGFLMIVAVIYIPSSAWQIAVTLTFCHTMIDLAQDLFSDSNTFSIVAARLAVVLIPTLLVSLLAYRAGKSQNILRRMFFLLVWSTVVVSFLRLVIEKGFADLSSLSIGEVIIGKFFVHLVFVLSAIFVSWMAIRKIKEA